MCLAGLSINLSSMTKDEIQEWLNKASCDAIAEWIIAGVATESNFALDLSREWIKSKNERIASCGWSTYSNYISVTDDSMIDIGEVSSLLDFIQLNIHQERNRVKYNMNGFVISVGTYILTLNSKALLVSKAIEKVIAKNEVGKKKKKCIC